MKYEHEDLDRYTKPASQIYEAGWYLWSHNKAGPWEDVQVFDWVRGSETMFQREGRDPEVLTGYFREAHDPKAPLLTIEEAAIDGYSPWGYVIPPDGKVHGLMCQYTHGVIAAVLYPDLALSNGFSPPISPIHENDVFQYQAFELENGREHLPLIRVSGHCNISRCNAPCTPEQIEGLRKAMLEGGMKLTSKVQTDFSEMSLKKALLEMAKDKRNE